MVSTRPSRVKGHLKRGASKPGRPPSATKATPKRKGDTKPKAKVSPAMPPKKTPQTTPKAEPASTPSGSAAKAEKKEKKVRVWWPPTKEKRKTQFSGAYWPAAVVKKHDTEYEVKYDNGFVERVDKENVVPYTAPVAFGEEKTPLQPHEFCEVFNGSKTDPAAWFGRIDKVEDDGYLVNYPFHDSKPEHIKLADIRRARVWDRAVKEWNVVAPFQEWEDGEVASPAELLHIPEADLQAVLKEGAAGAAQRPKKRKVEPKPVKKEPGRPGRKKKEPAPAATATAEDAEEEDKPAKKRRVAGKKAKGADEAASTPHAMPPPSTATFPTMPPGMPPMILPPNLLASLPPGSQLIPVMIPNGTPGGGGQMMMLLHPGMGFPPGTFPGLQSAAPAAAGAATAAAPAAAVTSPSTSAPAAAPAAGAATPTRPAPAIGPAAPAAAFAQQVTAAAAAAVAGAAGAGAAGAAVEAGAGAGAEVSEGAEEKPRKRKKDPHAPKRPITAYLVFVQRNREKVLSEFLAGQAGGGTPGPVSAADLSRLVAAKWKEVGEEERSACEEAAERDRQRYLQEMASYKPEGEQEEEEEEEAKEGEKKAKKDPNAPRKASSAYILFCKDFRKSSIEPKTNFAEATNKTAEAWRSVDAATRAKYEALSAADKERHVREAATYKAAAKASAAPPFLPAPAPAPARTAPPPTSAAKASCAPAPMQTAPPPAPRLPAGFQPAAVVARSQPSLPSMPPPFHMFRFPGPNTAPFQMFSMPPQQPPAPKQDPEVAEILEKGIDMKRAKLALARYYSTDAYHLLIDAWRQDSPKIADAIRSYKQNIKGYQRPDWKGFMIGIFGLEKMATCQKAPAAPTAPAATAAAAAPAPQHASSPEPSGISGAAPSERVGDEEGDDDEEAVEQGGGRRRTLPRPRLAGGARAWLRRPLFPSPRRWRAWPGACCQATEVQAAPHSSHWCRIFGRAHRPRGD